MKLCRVTEVKVLFLVLLYVFYLDLFEFSAAILEKVYSGSTVLLPWQHIGLQTTPILKAFLPLAFHFHICDWCLICMIQKWYKYVSLSLWPFFELKISNILKWSGWGLDKIEFPWKRNFFYSHKCVSSRTINQPSFNGLRCKLAMIAPFTSSASHLDILHVFILSQSSTWYA